MKNDETWLVNLAENIDRLITIDTTGRGIIRDLYEAARAKQGSPLTYLAARGLADRVGKSDVVIIATGMEILPWHRPEQDGPVGGATLARSLLLSFGAKPVFVTDPQHVPIIETSVKAAGLYVFPLEQLRDVPTSAAVVGFPVDPTEAETVTQRLLTELKPKALIAIERAGANEFGEYHAALGKNLTPWSGKIDVLFEQAKAQGIFTIGIGDGGNELGCGLIRDTVIEKVPLAAKCKCPCGGSIVPRFLPDVLIMACISNWGSYAIEALLAAMIGDAEVLHSAELDRRVHDYAAHAGANNDGPGLLDPGTDAVPWLIHSHIMDILAFLVRTGGDPGRLYRVPRYRWF
jgi:hypothetical protein